MITRPALRRATAAALFATAAALLAGCVVAPGRPYHGGAFVTVAPPPLRVEIAGSPPGAGYVWISGWWGWVGDRHVWHPGHWDAPRPGYRWEPHRWERDGPGWRERGGRWERD
ncbi:MAG: hypothetical protein ABT20_07995 [Rubrivivax sp. SCN 70-15]|nr:MAG: hypothetical protein ABT20_07995 [Rubrivivax sp. SCN 70-15]